MAEIKFEIIKAVGVLSESSKGWTKELNLISRNSRDPKYDIRDWDPEHEKMGKCIFRFKPNIDSALNRTAIPEITEQ